MPRLIRDTCALAGLQILRVHPRASSVAFRQRWRSEFAGAEVDWRGVRYDWERLGSELAPAFERRQAMREFDRRRSEADTALVARWLDLEEVYEVRGALPDHAWWRGHVGASDLFIVHGDWRWSFVLTHEEEGLGIGPFFVERVSYVASNVRRPSWGDSVRIRRDAAPAFRPGSWAAVCGIREAETIEEAEQLGSTVGSTVYLVEFGDGSSVEVPEAFVEIADED